MKAILIDPYTETISEVEHDGGYKNIYKLLSAPEHKVSTFTVVGLGDNETLYVDDEGLLKDPTHFFKWKDYHQPLAGRGLILGGDDEGDDVATKLTLDYVKSKVEWANDLEFLGQKPIIPYETDHPILGKAFVVGSTPIFAKKE